MSESPLIAVILFFGALYIAKLWMDDLKAAEGGNPNPKALPGASKVPMLAIWIGVAGAVALVILETAGELVLGVSTEQTDIAAIALLSMLGAGIIEEILFRGYLVITKRGVKMLILSAIGFSLLFALAHYQYYVNVEETETGSVIDIIIDKKSVWSVGLLFVNSLWFYTVRFFKWNPVHSLLPCFAAHIASNLAVFLVKLAQGHVTGLY